MLNKEESVLVQPCLVLCALLCFVAALPPPQPDTCAAAAAAAAAAAVLSSPPLPLPLLPRCGTWACLACTATHRVSLGARPFTPPWVRWSVLITACVGHIAAGTVHSSGDGFLGQIAYPLTVWCCSLLCWESLLVALCCAKILFAAKLFFFLASLFVCLCVFVFPT